MGGTITNSIDISPSYDIDHTVFAGTWDGVYRSVDGGNSWNFVSTMSRYEEISDLITYVGDWEKFVSTNASASQIKYSTTPKTRATLFFTGTSVSWIGTMSNRHGIAEVYIDGIFQTLVDQFFSQVLWQQELYTKTDLPYRLHSIAIVATGNKNPASLGTAMSVDAFDVLYWNTVELNTQ